MLKHIKLFEYYNFLHQEIGAIVSEEYVYKYIQNIHRNYDDFIDGDLGDRIEEFNYYQLNYVNIEEIMIDEWEIDDDLVNDYENMFNEKNEYPPIVLGEKYYGKYTIIDGTHRANALSNLGITKILAYIGLKNK